MRIAILGAGAMGSLFGGLLAEAGEEVTLLDINESHIEAINKAGLWISTDSGNRVVENLTAVKPSEASQIADLLLVFTKAIHTTTALKNASHLIGVNTSVLTLQNGLGNVEKISELVPMARIYVGVTTWPADMKSPGQIATHGSGYIKCFAATGQDEEEVKALCSLLNVANLNATAEPNIWTAVWEKVAFNASLSSICATTGCSVDQLGLLPAGIEMLERVVYEVCDAATSASVVVDRARVLANVRQAMSEHIGHKPSMLQDVLSGRQTEIESINGAVARVAKQHGISTPCTEMLAILVRLMDERNKIC